MFQNRWVDVRHHAFRLYRKSPLQLLLVVEANFSALYGGLRTDPPSQ